MTNHCAGVVELRSFLLPVEMRVPLKFGAESIDQVTCLRVEATIESSDGKTATGWGETPLSVTWAWPSQDLSYADRYQSMLATGRRISDAILAATTTGHAMDLGHHLCEHIVASEIEGGQTPHLASLIIASAYDLAIHDAYGKLFGVDTYATYGEDFLDGDLGRFFDSSEASKWQGKKLQQFLVAKPPTTIPVWHLVGGLDPIEDSDLTGSEPDDGYPVTLRQWIKRDGLTHLKIKLRGNDAQWDFDRTVRIGKICESTFGLQQAKLSTDFNCTVTDPQYVNDILDRLKVEHPEIRRQILYVEQPFPHDLPTHQIDVHSVSDRCDLFLDESAHDWRLIRLGRQLGWTGVALKTCKTQTGALLSMCWAKANSMPLMVQDLTNPMLAQIPHVRLAAHAGTIAGVESNGMQFYPDASLAEQAVHPGLYRRRDGQLDLSTLGKTGFGYRVDEIRRTLPDQAW